MRCVCRNDEETSCFNDIFAGITDVPERAAQNKTELLVLVLMSRHRTATLQLELRGGHCLGRNVTAGEQRRQLLEGELRPADLFGLHSAKLTQPSTSLEIRRVGRCDGSLRGVPG